LRPNDAVPAPSRDLSAFVERDPGSSPGRDVPNPVGRGSPRHRVPTSGQTTKGGVTSGACIESVRACSKPAAGLVSVKVKALDQRRNEEFHCEYCRNGAHIAWRSFCCRLSFCQFDCLAANFCSLAEEGQCDDLAVVCTESEGAALR